MLIDFGIAKEAIDSEQTRALGRAVTHGFSPPEQAMGAGTDVRSDVYALGATIYYMLTAQRPPGARERIQGVEVALPSSLVPGTPPAIDRALLQALSLNPNERQQTVQEFGRAFDYDAPTVKTYDDFAAPERTVMVGSAATTRSVPNTAPQKSLKLGPDGAAVLVDQYVAAPRGNRRLMLILGVAGLVAVAILTVFLSRAKPPPTAAVTPTAATPPASPTLVAPALPSSPATTQVTSASPAPAITAAAAPPAMPASPVSASPTTGTSAMDELLKRRQGNASQTAMTPPEVVQKPAPKPKPAQPSAPKPAPVAAAVPPVAPPAPAVGASAWQKANANTQFQE